jgi:twitching motility protein PilT
MNLNEVLEKAAELNASDVHLTVNISPVFRIQGELVVRKDWPSLTSYDLELIAKDLLPGRQRDVFEEKGEVDFAYSLPGRGRFRVNVFRQRGSVAIALRLLNYSIPSLEELGLPLAADEFIKKDRGLVLVTGPTGSGKTTTLAAMVGRLNKTRALHIITLEDPIEYLHTHQKSIVNQREIGSDSHSFASALRVALREDPDVILVGEMSDLETISTAITAAETGHLILATLHTSSAAQAVERIIDVFPPHQQSQIRLQVADVLIGVLTQQLIPLFDHKGRVAAVEIMVGTPAVKNLIRESKTHQLPTLIQTGAKYGMKTMDMALKELYNRQKISREEFVARLSDRSLLTGE